MALRLCKYIIQDIAVIFDDGSTSSIPAMQVSFFSIEKNFFQNFLPIFNLKAMVTKELYKKINNVKCKFKIDIRKFYVDSNGNNNYNKNKVLQIGFINNIFINTNDGDNTPYLSDAVYDRTIVDGLEQRNEYETANTELDLYLFMEDCINYRQLNDKTFQDCTVVGAIMAFAQLTEQRPMLITYPDNKEVISSLPIPDNLTFIGGIEFLQSVYGIYNKGYILFNDFDCLYLIDKDTKCNAYKKNEITRIMIKYSESTKDISQIYGEDEDLSNNRYLLNCTDQPKLIDISSTTSNILFDNIVSVDAKTGTNKGTKDGNVKVIDNKYNNDYSLKSYQYETSLTAAIECTFKELDVEIFKVNREYYIEFDTPNAEYRKMNGFYKLMALMSVYIKTDEEIFENTIKAKFVRA